jgi:hypothetical protein
MLPAITRREILRSAATVAAAVAAGGLPAPVFALGAPIAAAPASSVPTLSQHSHGRWCCAPQCPYCCGDPMALRGPSVLDTRAEREAFMAKFLGDEQD